HVGQSSRSGLKVGDSGGRSSKTSPVIRTANTPSENMLTRSGVALRGAVMSFPLLAWQPPKLSLIAWTVLMIQLDATGVGLKRPRTEAGQGARKGHRPRPA